MIEWIKIKKQIQYFIVALLCSVVLVGISLYLHFQDQAVWEKSKRSLLHAKVKYQQAQDRQALLTEYEKKFNSLKDRGIYGEEQRIQWIETIQASSDRRKIPAVRFAVSQRSTLDKGSINVDLSSIDIHMSKMKLDFELLHEGDLFGLLGDLDESAHGLYVVDRCSIKRNASEQSLMENGLSPNFVGHCRLLWLTFDEERQYQGNEDI